MSKKRSFLFLQGCTSPFFRRLGEQLKARGHAVFRINFNVGDAAYWGNRPAWSFRGPVTELTDFLQEKFSRVGFSDVIMLGDTRPIHLPVKPIARQYGTRMHILEEGYFRPNWITLEQDGINGYSRLPKDPDWYRTVGRMVPDAGDGKSVSNPIRLLALHELGYHLPNLLNPLLFPGYRTHRPHNSAIEFLGWGRRFARMPYYERRDRQTIQALIQDKAPFFLLPLQLQSDSQIKVHSTSRGVPFLVKEVMSSFIRHAPQASLLVIKNHPLDTGFIEYASWIKRLERRLGLEGRIRYLESGHLPTLLNHTQGVITVNSSIGTSALIHNCPVIALGDAIYDIEGLTFQQGLTRFWNELEHPDQQLLRAFRNTVIHTTQINGGFYTRRGIKLAVDNCCQRFDLEQSPLDRLLEISGR